MCVICAYMYVIHLCRTISVWLHSLISVRQHFALVKLLANLCSVAQGLSYLNGGIFQGNRKTKIPVSISDFELNLKLNQKKKEKLRSDSRGKSLTKEISHAHHRRGRLAAAAAAADGEALRRRKGSPASRPTAPPEKLGEAISKGGG